MAEISDALALVERCRQGERAAWRTLFNEHFDFVWRVARRLGTPPAELDDVCQEVFLVVFRKLDAFSTGRLTTWIYRITANIVSDRHRRRRYRSMLTAMLGQDHREHSAPPTPEQNAQQREAAQMVSEVLQAMKPKKRETFALYELEGLSGPEIAERVGCRIETVWARLHHARKDFARIAKKKGFVSWSEET